MKRLTLACLALFVFGCGPRLMLTSEALDSYQVPEPSEYPHSWGVYLDWEDQYVYAVDAFWPVGRCEAETRRVFAVLNENIAEGQLTEITLHKKAKLTSFSAQLIRPNGDVITLDKKSLRDDTVTILVEDDEDDDDDDDKEPVFKQEDYKRKILILPAIEVGSLIEIRYAVKSKWESGACPSFASPAGSSKPVLRYTITRSVPDSNRYRVHARNTESEPTLTKRDGQVVFTWTTDEFASVVPEDFGAPTWFARPMYHRQHVQYVNGNYVSDTATDWAKVLGSTFAKPIVDDKPRKKLFKDVDLALDTEGCTGDCLVDRALTMVREKFRPSGKWRAFSSVKSLSKEIKKGKLSVAGRGLLVWKLLTDAGLDAKLALVSPLGRASFGLDAPMYGVFTVPMVYVPKGGGVETPIWIDPDCDACTRGQQSPYTFQAPAIVAAGVDEGLKKNYWDFLYTVTNGTRAHGRVLQERLDVALAADGNARVEVSQRAGGDYAIGALISQSRMRKGSMERRARGISTWRFPGSVFESHQDLACDRAAGQCTRKYSVKAPVARADTNQLVLPLALWSDSRGNYFDAAERKRDIYISSARTLSDAVTVTAPAEYTVAQVPKTISLKSALGTFTLASDTKDGKTTVTRTLELKPGLYSKDDYEALRAPVRAFVAARGDVVVFAKPPPPAPPEPAEPVEGEAAPN